LLHLAVEPPPPEPSFLGDLSSWALVAGGPLLILLLGLLFLVGRQNQTKEAAGLVVAEATDREVLAEAETETEVRAEEALDLTRMRTPSSLPVWPESPDLEVPLELALDATAKPSPSAPAKPSEEPYELDLSDRGGWDLEVHLPPNAPEPAPIAPTAPQETLDLMTPSLGNLILAPQAPTPAPESVLDLTAGDFDLDLESLGKLGAATGPAEGDQPHEPLVDLDLDLDDLMDLDLSAFASADKQADQAQAAPPSNPPLDWGALGIDLELEEAEPEEPPLGKSPPVTDFPADFQMDSGPWDEVGIKLDLARAYLQMDDPEAARAILVEAIAEGTGDQIAEAKAMLARLE
ncbi:MAG: FimV/HubP family polar landmark protein, partial [Chromatiaceae bacterium]